MLDIKVKYDHDNDKCGNNLSNDSKRGNQRRAIKASSYLKYKCAIIVGVLFVNMLGFFATCQ